MSAKPRLILGTGSRYDPRNAAIGRELITVPARALMHTHCIGKSGYGKSYWLASLFLMLLACGMSATLIDPAGDLSRLVLKLLIVTRFFETYPDAFSRLVYLDIPKAMKRDMFVPYNVLATGYDPYTTGNMVLEAFKRLWPALQGGTSTNIETLVKNGAAVLAMNSLPLLPYLGYLFTNAAFRECLLANVHDEVIRSSFAQYGFTRSGQIPASLLPTIKKISLLSFAPVLRYSLGQQENVLDFRAMLDDNRSVIINLNLPDPDALRLLGCLYTVYAEMGVRSRGEIPAERRRGKHMLLLDEFQNFVAQSGDALSTIFEQCRKYGLFLCLAHQYWGQVPEGLRGALNQCEIAVAFHLERTDAKISAELLGFPYIERLPKPAQFNPLNPTHLAQQYYSRSEQREQHVDEITRLKKREALARLPDSRLYRMRALDVDDRGVSNETLSEIEETYFRLYFRSRRSIDTDTASHLRELESEDIVVFEDGIVSSGAENNAPEEGDDYDLF